ncbi:MAG: NAD(P)-dependent oxidoreductase [Pirellulales bacterium]|nr:NAD(P)-dependent oxidoreductase [Pirellulales bacterium]
MAKVLVTGASGFIGRHLVSALVSQGDEVACLVRPTSRVDWLKPFEIQLFHGDITESGGLSQYVAGRDYVYHLAGRTLALTSGEYYRVNQLGVRNIAEACAKQTTPPVLLTVSSLAAAGPAVWGRPSIESDPPVPVSVYGRSKRAGEIEAEARADRVPITVVRPPIVLGEGDKMGLSMFWSIDRFGFHLVPSLGRNRFSLIHVADLVELILRAARRGRRLPPPPLNGSPRTGEGYYFASCEVDPVYDDLGRMIGKALECRRVFPVHLAVPLVWMVSAGVEAISRIERRPLYLHIDKAREITAGSWCCTSRAARADFDFQVGAPLADRLRQTVEWYRREGWL